MSRTTTPKPADSAKPTSGKPTSNLFNAFDPAALAKAADANLFNSYNSGMTRQMMADERSHSYLSNQGVLQQSKEAAGFGSMQGVLANSAQTANQAAAQQAAAQQNTLGNFSSQSGIGQGAGTLAFGGQVNQSPKQDIFGRPLGTAQNLQDQILQRQQDYRQSDRTAAINAANQLQQSGQQQSSDRSLARLQGENQIQAAKVAANAQLGSAAIGAQSNMMSSLFGALGNMTSSIGGGGGRRGYW